jgi:uncharacterized surface protein with fasciclin (FAS1) repeats
MDYSKSVPTTGPAKSVVDTAIAADHFSRFVTGLKATGLIEALSGKGPFTVFVPTDEAFRRLPAGAYETLLKDTAKLKAILSYHVVSGTLMTKDVKAGEVMTLQGTTFTASASPGVKVNGSRVTQADIVATNGVIHAIDAVIVPRHMQLLAAAA